MKLLSIAFIMFFVNPKPIPWEKDFVKATTIAVTKKQNILLNFSGSDWCGYCQEMHKKIIGTDAFINYAIDNLVLVNADFPNRKKNKLPTALALQNKRLAAKYNPNGVFPLTVLLNADGVVLKKWEGLPRVKTAAFISELKAVK